MRVGITGHSNLTDDSSAVVADAIRAALAELGEPLIGVSCLARGADQLFARVVIELGGALQVVLPAADYRERKVKPHNRAAFESLLSSAADVRVMPFDVSNRDAYMAASEAVLSEVEHMIAVWDGQPTDGHGGTGDVVSTAHRRRLPVTVVWPTGAQRE